MNEDTIKILIVDDEPEARDLLSMLLEPVKGVKIAGYAENVDQALARVEETDPDLILLDIQMPVKSGFELVDSLRNTDRNVGYIFVTAYDTYAIEAMRASAIDYLLKPVDPELLKDAIWRFREKRQQQLLNEHIDELLNDLGIGRRIKVNTRTGFLVIDPKHIVCCTADGNYTEIIMANGRSEIISSNLGSMEKEFASDGFFRISRSALINLSYLTHVNSKASICRLEGNTVIELKVARNRLGQLGKTTLS
ncbi:MAG: LytTR family DNA-binding domain-containing protein [Bacteroidota bacterium]